MGLSSTGGSANKYEGIADYYDNVVGPAPEAFAAVTSTLVANFQGQGLEHRGLIRQRIHHTPFYVLISCTRVKLCWYSVTAAAGPLAPV